MLRLTQLYKTFPNQPAPIINGLDIEVEDGESISIRGASGCGKSTLLSLVAGFDAPTSGDILIGGKALLAMKNADAFRRHHLGVVFQSYNLFDCFNVWDNIAFTSRLKGNYDSHFQASLMEKLGIGHLANQPLSQLSGGEQQRAAIARALVHKPSLILADEPTGNLDEDTSELVANTLFDVCEQLNTTLVVVTHSEDVAQKAKTPYWLHKGQLKRERA
jgi:putative ABC transport system ATP-binding protein